jgi:sec-independent protein translocase protein TatC
MSSDDQESRESRDGTPASAEDSRRDAEDQPSDETAAPVEPEGPQEPGEPQEGVEASTAQAADEGGSDDDAPAETGAHKDDPPTATYYDDPYQEYEYNYQEPQSEKAAVDTAQPEPAKAAPPPPPPPEEDEDTEDDDEEGMSRMSFLEHLEELRTRIIRALVGLIVAYAIALTAKDYLFQLMRRPFDEAVATIKLTSPDVLIQLVALTPIEQFHLIWFKLPILASLFLAAPWWMLQAWSFVAPGLYKKERRWAVPFILSGGVLFMLGGAFGYFVALKFALAFLLDVGGPGGVVPMIGISAYSDMFIGILLGLGVVFQMPIVIFILTALRIASPQFLMNNVRYAILIIFILAAVITPTPDIFNMITFAAPMILLFYVGIVVSYLFLLKREGRSLPWGKISLVFFVVMAIIAAVAYYMYAELGYHLVREFPWFVPPGP